VLGRQIAGGHCSAAAEGRRSMTKRLANVELQLHAEKACDGAASQDAFGCIESSLSDIFQAAVKPPSSHQAAGTVVHPRAVLFAGPVVLILLYTVIRRSTGLFNKLTEWHHRVPIASKAAA
jgi:hypothetical protein